MKSMIITAFIACACCATGALAQNHHPAQGIHEKAHDAKPINAMCPIGEEAIDPDTSTIEYKGDTIGFCCPSCDKKFMAWDEAKRDAFVAQAKLAQPHEGHNMHTGKDKPGAKEMSKSAKKDAKQSKGKAGAWSGPFPLNTCPVSGEVLGEDGDPIVKVYDGREIKFCCTKCVSKFEKNQAKYMAQIDEQIIKDQMPFYPMTTCVVSGEPLVEDGEDIAINKVYGNRLVRLCCNMCKKEFKEDPAKFIAELDKAAADQQRENYPLTTCPVSGEELGGMGEPTEAVIAGRLFRFCCSMCEPKVRANPAKYIAELDAARKAAQP